MLFDGYLHPLSLALLAAMLAGSAPFGLFALVRGRGEVHVFNEHVGKMMKASQPRRWDWQAL